MFGLCSPTSCAAAEAGMHASANANASTRRNFKATPCRETTNGQKSLPRPAGPKRRFAPSLRSQLALDLVDQLEVELEQPSQEAVRQVQVLAAMRQGVGACLVLVEAREQ